ncbi:hypothetical protein NEOLI_002197 [Neolecta irregularis DAH-3]|uniref:Uncharacterized protein n=1 Tax=Neolecta irregularis (strain DAH-3) TaxID=1198029 RepID=A0A1U7LWH6_NEOID|nr:hypothetical protein NEOLI_002197 [Neolecta irregularis DAH-3]|eukprot:OLL26923.1 hypothetical protein NEOLI_002197 [Neolecta irregularis DAH-3]
MTVVAEKGYVIVTTDSVVSCLDGRKNIEPFSGQETGVRQELEAFVCSIVTGERDTGLVGSKDGVTASVGSCSSDHVD